MEKGRYSFDITIIKYTSHMMIGCSKIEFDANVRSQNVYPGLDGNSWGYFSYNGGSQKLHNNSYSNWGEKFGSGDVIRVILDFGQKPSNMRKTGRV